MSAVVETFIVCDNNCGNNFGVDQRNFTAAQHRARFKYNGWVHYKGKDYCPGCFDYFIKPKKKP